MSDTEVRFSSCRPQGRTVLTVRTGDASTTATDLNLQGATQIRVFVDHTLVAFDDAGSVLLYMRPGMYWSFLWQ